MRAGRQLLSALCLAVACAQSGADAGAREADDPEAREAAAPPIAAGALEARRAAVIEAQARHWRELEADAPVWRPLGPAQVASTVQSGFVSGRVRAFATHPSNPQILYVATAGGGVWKTTNADPAPGAKWTWTPLTDALPATSATGNIAVGGLALDAGDPETVYVALGDPLSQGAARGFFVSHDGGASWSAGGDVPATQVYAVASPAPRVVLVASTTGLFRSADGGASFAKVTFGAPAARETAWSIAQFGDGTVLCARSGDDADPYTALWTSADAGATWTRGQMPAMYADRVTVAAARGTAWALVSSGGSVQPGLLRSADGGRTWTWLSGAPFDATQGWYNQSLAVDPDAPDHVFVGVRSAYRTLDGGVTWEAVGDLHGDHQAAAWIRAGGVHALLAGDDGGVALLRDPWATQAAGFVDNTHNAGLATQLVYAIDGLAGDPAAVALGMQDNGTVRRVGDTGAFNPLQGGDGFAVLLDSSGTKTMIGMNGFVYVAQDGYLHPSTPAPTPFVVPLFRDAGDASGNTVFTLSRDRTTTWRTRDFGASWQQVAYPVAGFAPDSIAASSPKVLALGGQALLSADGGDTWAQIATPPAGATSAAIASGALYAYGDVAQVWTSTDGSTWTALPAAGLPQVPLRKLAGDPVSPSVLWAATDAGVYRSDDAGQSFSRYGAGQPWVAARDLYLAPDGSLVRVATFGRGVWEVANRTAAPRTVVSAPAAAPAQPPVAAQGGCASLGGAGWWMLLAPAALWRRRRA